ncbi:hypothetical protein DERP_000463 [Dermatophagoides pteronyssinus]|uniref:Uncharacterized protein n=1 Tax=Dermatophagoides pteronyssinus TaxID=6956 RepID=A0ABQ8J099_DERPT|nr:hypothetical protein DERP_000463 [Dermatophagoides pteronyssinus]
MSYHQNDIQHYHGQKLSSPDFIRILHIDSEWLNSFLFSIWPNFSLRKNIRFFYLIKKRFRRTETTSTNGGGDPDAPPGTLLPDISPVLSTLLEF